MKKLNLILLLFLSLSTFAQTESSNKLQKKIDNYLKETIEVNQIPGTAVAVIKKRRNYLPKILWQKFNTRKYEY